MTFTNDSNLVETAHWQTPKRREAVKRKAMATPTTVKTRDSICLAVSRLSSASYRFKTKYFFVFINKENVKILLKKLTKLKNN
jgi:hypothetical protein